MITKSDAIKIGKELVKPAIEALAEPTLTYRHIIRGTVLNNIDNIWDNVFTKKLRIEFITKDRFYDDIGWK